MRRYAWRQFADISLLTINPSQTRDQEFPSVWLIVTCRIVKHNQRVEMHSETADLDRPGIVAPRDAHAGVMAGVTAAVRQRHGCRFARPSTSTGRRAKVFL
jgi:hypothetical protein